MGWVAVSVTFSAGLTALGKHLHHAFAFSPWAGGPDGKFRETRIRVQARRRSDHVEAAIKAFGREKRKKVEERGREEADSKRKLEAEWRESRVDFEESSRSRKRRPGLRMALEA